jgi:twinkle protein
MCVRTNTSRPGFPVTESTADFVAHEPCPKCGSSDSFGRYADGGGHCFSQGCGHHEFADGTNTESSSSKKANPALLSDGEYKALTKRGLTEESCRKWGYQVGKMGGKVVQIANYVRDGKRVAQKVRDASKNFVILGDGKSMGLYGQHLWRDGGKKLIVTEGEIDAISVSQLQGHKWPVVSVPKGAAGAKKALATELQWLEKFEEVILMFDNDDAGNSAIEECAPLFTPGRCKVARLPLKDANEMLLAGRGDEVIKAIWDAKEYRPEAVLSVMDAYEEATRVPTPGLDWPWPTLTSLTYGIQRKTAYYCGAGVGVGKTNWAVELQSFLVNHHKVPVGVFMLEQSVGRTLKGIAGKFVGKAFHRPDAEYSQDELREAIASLEGNVYLYNHATSGTDWDSIKAAIRYMVISYGVKDIFLDNLTVMVAHLPSSEANDEVNRIAKEIAQLLQELDFTLYGFSHLNPPVSGPSHERGGKVLESQFTGSRGLMRFGHYMFGIERNKDPELSDRERNTSTFVLLKDREYGNVGQFEIYYNPKTDQYLEPTGFEDSYDESEDSPTEDQPF